MVVFASRFETDEADLRHILERKERDGRFASDPETHKARMHAGRSMFVDMHKHDLDVRHWMEKRVYLSLGAFLLGVAAPGIDATPMEGVDLKMLDQEIGLRERGCSSLFVVPLGYHDPKDDYNAGLPKSRLPEAEILTEL